MKYLMSDVKFLLINFPGLVLKLHLSIHILHSEDEANIKSICEACSSTALRHT